MSDYLQDLLGFDIFAIRFTLESSCNNRCAASCTTSEMVPICGANGATYFSPCHAGCGDVTFTRSFTVGWPCWQAFAPFLPSSASPVSYPFLEDLQGFRVASDLALALHPWSPCRNFPMRRHFTNCSHDFCFMSSFNVLEPFQPSPSQDHRYLFHPYFLRDLLTSPKVPIGSHPSAW